MLAIPLKGINPGDKKHSFKNITKIVSGDTKKTLSIVAGILRKLSKQEYIKQIVLRLQKQPK